MGVVKTRGLAQFTAVADQSGKEGYGVTLAAAGVSIATGATDNVIGVITEGGELAGGTDVALFGAIDGTVRCKAGGAITAGSRVMLKADGTFDCAATGLCCGVALEAAAVGELFEVAPRTPVTIS